MEIKYPYFLGGEMLDGYQDNDQVMAQASVDAACHSATIIERERIFKLLEEADSACCDLAIALIRGKQDEDACEPSDSPCVNGWSCQKHRMTIEQMTDFIALIKGEK